MERVKQARWDAAHMATVATKMKVSEYMVLRALCAAAGTTPYALIKVLLRRWMKGFVAAGG